MIEKLKKNTKIKIISLLSAVVLWMYVMAVVDPEDTQLYEGIPVTITNLNEIKDLGLVVDPEEDLVASVYVKGHLSDLQKISEDNITVYGTVNNPIEGKNQLYLRANASDKVTIDFKSDTIVINLEKEIKEEKNINVKITGKYKDSIDDVTLDHKTVIVSGPRSRVDDVKYVQANFVADEKYSKDYSTQIALQALNSDMKIVDDVTLEFKNVKAQVSYLQQKQVKVNPLFENTSNLVEGQDYTISPKTISITGKKANISGVDYIDTEFINVDNFNSNSKVIGLKLPDGISSNTKDVTIKLLNKKSSTDSFTYLGNELNLLNNNDNVSLENFEVPNEIKVTVKYDNSSNKVSKNKLKLYIDLSDGFVANKEYMIIHSDINAKSVSIEPSYIKSK